MTSFMSEFLLTEVAVFIRKVAIERERRVLHQRIDAEMNALNWLTPGRSALERPVELRQVLRLDDDVEFAEAGWGEAELAPCQAEALDLPLGFQVAEIFPHRLHEGGIAYARLEVAPDVIEVHAASRPKPEWTQNVQAANEEV